MRRSGCWMRRRRLRPHLRPQLQLHRRYVRRPPLPHRQRPPLRQLLPRPLRRQPFRPRPRPHPLRPPRAPRQRLPRPPLSRAALDELNTACQSGEASACTKLLPVVEAECAQKIGPACGFAGFLYEHGRGVAANAALAASFYNQSCEAGDKMGCIGFALLQARGTGVIQNEAKAQATLSAALSGRRPRGLHAAGAAHRAWRPAGRHGACAGAPDQGLRRQAPAARARC